MEKIKEFLRIDTLNGYGNRYGYGDGNGYGNGYGEGYGYGNGEGNGDGNGYGNGYGEGNGDGNGYGNGDGYGNGNGDGNGYGNGNGEGYGEGNGLKSLNNKDIHIIDNIQTIIKSVKNNVAKGFIVNMDLTLTPCYIVKGEGNFAHGSTLEIALEDLQSKLLQSKPIEQRIAEFIDIFKFDIKYPASLFYKWHYFLTGSCDLGRKSFCADRDIDLDIDEFTVKEFISLVKDSYGSEVIKQLMESYNQNKK